MKRFLRFIISFVASFVALFLSGYVNFINQIHSSLVITTFFGSALVLSAIFMLVWEMYLNCMNKIHELSYRIEKLEEENEKLKDSDAEGQK